MKKFALIGSGGHAREIMAQIGSKLTCFVDDFYANNEALPLSTFNPDEFSLMIAVADSTDRESIINRLPKNTTFFSWIHPTAILMDKNIMIGEGSFIGAYSILTTNVVIGKHAIINRGNQIGHDCRIGDFFSIMPNAVIGGNVNIGDCVYMGSCSNIKEKINICDNVTIGMNAAVVKDINVPGTYVGVPAKKYGYEIKT
jgi:sugar O-acyltransferase (sialic acid O-acetyltransferase NeuD family)